MRAVVVDRLGGPETLSVSEDRDRPVAAEGQVLIEVALAGVNPADVAQRETGVNHLGPAAALPFVPGGEVVGRRADSGERVVAICGSGGYAAWAVAPERQVVPVPDGVTDEDALTLIVQGLTAWHLLRTAIDPASVLVNAAGSAVATFLLQLAARSGVETVIATARSAEARDRALEIGATVALAEDDPALADAVRQASGGRGVDLALDAVGGTAFDAALDALAARGRLVVYGAASGDSGTVPARRLIAGSRSVSGFWLLDHVGDADTLRDDVAALAALVRDGELRPPDSHRFALSDVRAAHEALAARTARGKLVLDPTR